MITHTRSYARIGLMGNPSDGFYGKTISCAIRNFWAEVILWESPTLQIVPHKEFDLMEFPNLGTLCETANKDGYYGGLRLLYATCKRFHEYCLEHGIELSDSRFTITYDTNIPRQVGLGGSSAIIGALTKALMEFHNISYDIMPKPMLPHFLLSVERDELHIRAGLQDRVIQIYGGIVYIDFAKQLMESQGYGNYEYIDSQLVHNLFVAYTKHPNGESGQYHNPIHFRFEQGDEEVVNAMSTFASYAQQARDALLKRDYAAFGELMDKNMDLRRTLYGDHVLGEENLEMIQIACRNASPVKFCGSGGSVVGMYRTDDQFGALQKDYQRKRFGCVQITVDLCET